MGSIEEEDLASSVDFEFYDPGGHKDENVTFNKVYSKPPPGRHRSISTPNKVCYENSIYNGTSQNNDQQHENNGLSEAEINERKKDSIPLINGIRRDTTRSQKNENNDVDEDDENVLFASSEENGFQSGLDVSISDDTEDEDDDIYAYKEDLLDGKTAGNNKDQSSSHTEELNCSGRERNKTKYTEDRTETVNNHERIIVPHIRQDRHFQCSSSASCSSESSSLVNNDFNESDLSSLDDDDDDIDDDADSCSDDDGLNSTDDEDDDDEELDDDDDEGNNKNCNNAVGLIKKSLGKNGPTPPRKILRKNGLSFAERYSLQKSKRNNNNHISSSRSNRNCNNNIEDDDDDDEDISSASEMTDVSPLASSAENSPTTIRKYKPSPTDTTYISVCSKDTLNGKNGVSCKKASEYMDMNVIMQAVDEISKEDEEKWKRCSSKISSSSSSSSPIRKRNNNNKTNLTYSNDRARQIEKENERLLSQLLKFSKSYKVGKKVPLKTKVSHSAINRQREHRRIDRENEAFLRRLQSAKPSQGLSRDAQLEEYNSKHLKCPKNKSTRNNGSPCKRPFTATSSSSSRNSIISLATDTNSIALSKRSVYHQSTPTINNRPEWVSKW